MYEKIARLLHDYNQHMKMADEEFVNQIIDIICTEKGLHDYISKIEIVPYSDKEKVNFSSDYGMRTKKLKINLNSRDKYLFESTQNKLFLYNTKIVINILHELDHACLKKSICLNENTIDVNLTNILFEDIIEPKIVSMSKEEIAKLTETEKRELKYELYCINSLLADRNANYQLYHDKAPFEKRANINSLIEFNEVLELLYTTKLNDDSLEKIRLRCLKTLIKKCRYGYKIIDDITNCPSFDYVRLMGLGHKLFEIDIYDRDIKKAYTNAISRYSERERVLYGLPLSKDELSEINKYNNPLNVYMKKKTQ